MKRTDGTTTDETERAKIGERLKEARRYVGFSQEEVATLLKVPRTAVSEMESGHRRVEALELKRLAEIYRQSVGFLTGEEDVGVEMSAEVIHLARQANALSADDRAELGRFAEYLRSKRRGDLGDQ